MSVQAFELLRDIEGPFDHRIAVSRSLQARLVIDCATERDGIERVLRDQLAQFVDLAIGHLQDTADIAQNGACLQPAERNDLGYAVAAVTLLHVADHFVAAILTEIDIEVGHGYPLRIEEALEQ